MDHQEAKVDRQEAKVDHPEAKVGHKEEQVMEVDQEVPNSNTNQIRMRSLVMIGTEIEEMMSFLV